MNSMEEMEAETEIIGKMIDNEIVDRKKQELAELEKDLAFAKDKGKKEEIEGRLYRLRASMRTEEELKKLPTYPQYFYQMLEKRGVEKLVLLKRSGLFFHLFNEMDAAQIALCELSQDSHMFKTDSDEFKEKQKEWWGVYGHLLNTREYIARVYAIPPPNILEMLPERYYCGVCLSEEDFGKFVMTSSKKLGVRTIEHESDKDYITPDMIEKEHALKKRLNENDPSLLQAFEEEPAEEEDN